MRIDTRPDGSQIVIPEVGDLVRLTRDEAGPIVTAYAGEWGRIVRVTTRNTLDIQLAGFSRPRGVAMALVSDFPAINVVPCDGRGLPTDGRHWGSWEERRGGGAAKTARR
ncbi:MAG: hypothetical protein INF65_15830 [Roseomonas sp.]|jgi:hypothetical protein|nr:hypothetical protein [Roseomonas sp.]MCZ8142636.1 hypothetical protein [Acetobacteraceae bacterium]MCA3393505.1 hypothetical protein [Roseomonas sp.]MCA3407994.1 hypothetical protein [Roseomonas sp.]MCA3414377.1 hypothetical protein [Roseomonas sp.]